MKVLSFIFLEPLLNRLWYTRGNKIRWTKTINYREKLITMMSQPNYIEVLLLLVVVVNIVVFVVVVVVNVVVVALLVVTDHIIFSCGQ